MNMGQAISEAAEKLERMDRRVEPKSDLAIAVAALWEIGWCYPVAPGQALRLRDIARVALSKLSKDIS